MIRSILLLTITLFVLSKPFVAFSQSSQEELETQKRLNEVESKRATSSATSSANKKPPTITFVEGVIHSANNSVIVLSTESGNKMIYTNDSTKFINIDANGKKLIGFGDLKIGETVSVVGLPKEKGSGTAKVVVRDNRIKTGYFSTIGKVSEITETDITLKNFSGDLPSKKLNFTANSVVKKDSEVILLKDLKTGDKVVASGTIDEKGSLLVSEILLL